MKGKYVLNTETGKLHLLGCHCISTNNPHHKLFDTEEEARKQDALSVGWCKFCLKKREKMLKESLEKEI